MSRRPTAHLVKYEHDFISKCKEFRLSIKWDETGDPYVTAKGKYRKVVSLCSWGVNKFAVIIMANHPKTMNAIVKKIEEAVPRNNWLENNNMILDSEAVVIIMDLDNIKKLIGPLSLRQKKVLSDEHKKKLMAALSKAKKKQ